MCNHQEAGADEAAGKAENVRDQAETSVAEPEASGARPQAAAFSGPADIRRPDTTGPFLQPGQIQAAADTGKLYLVGPAGSGKSVALAALAHWARTAGWLVSSDNILSLCTDSSLTLEPIKQDFDHLGQDDLAQQVSRQLQERSWGLALFKPRL